MRQKEHLKIGLMISFCLLVCFFDNSTSGGTKKQAVLVVVNKHKFQAATNEDDFTQSLSYRILLLTIPPYTHDNYNKQRPGMMSKTTESCLLSLDYAWFHTINCLLLIFVMYYTPTLRKHLSTAHTFGLFAMLSDYGLMYLVKGTRQLFVLRDGNSVDFDDLHGIGIFLFFLWFDYIGAVALIGWARTLAEAIREGGTNNHQFSTIFVIFQHAIMWWTAPVLAPYLGIDDRELILSRESPKATYLLMFCVFSVLLFRISKIKWREYLSILLSGLGCGSLHHAALFFHSMRGYKSSHTLLLTMCTEWPALMCLEGFFRTSGAKYISLPTARRTMVLFLVAMLIPHLPNDEQATEFLISSIPGHHMQSFGTHMLKLKTCVFPKYIPTFGQNHLKCRGDSDSDSDQIWLITTPAKSGAVLSAKLLLDISSSCNLCLGSGTRDTAGIPGPGTHVPIYKGQTVHAIMDMEEWPEYVTRHAGEGNYKCVTMTRDPLSRLRSLYLYSRSGGEHWVRYETSIMRDLRSADSLLSSLELFWNSYGKEYLLRSHDSYKLESTRGCVAVPFESLSQNFTEGAGRILDAFGVLPEARGELLQRLLRHDRSNPDDEQKKLLEKDIHVSSKKFTREFIGEVEKTMMDDLDGGRAGEIIRGMRKEMDGF